MTRSLTSLLALTTESEAEGFEDDFEEVVQRSLADAAIETGELPAVRIGGTDIEDYDSIYINPEPKAAIYARVLLESLQDRHIDTNLSPSAFLIMTKKHYLFKVLSERNVPIPRTVALSTANGLTGLEETLEFPVAATMYSGFEREGVERVEDMDGLSSIAERAEHGENVVIVQEVVDGDLYDALYVDGEAVSVKIEGERWEVGDDATMNYHSLSSEQEESVEAATDAIGTDLCRVRLKGERVVDVSSDPALQRFADLSGKNVYGKASEMLRGDAE